MDQRKRKAYTGPGECAVPTYLDNEEWRSISGIEAGYEVSNLGRIRSWRTAGKSRAMSDAPRVLKGGCNRKRGGYLSVTLCSDNKIIHRCVHHVVLEAFAPPRAPGQLTRHLDGDPTNNRLDNITWGSEEENFEDQVRHGTDTRGERNGGAKLTQAQADAIRVSTERGVDLARLYGLSNATICRIRKGIRYGATG